MNTEQFDGHTPGPWCANEWGTDGEWMPEEGWAVQHLAVNEPLFPDEAEEWVCLADNEADARLIAAAPDLLADVKRLRQAFLIATGHVGYGNHLGHNELRHALNSAGIDADSLSWADEEWSEEE